MVVCEPSLMGGEFGDEDERLISRLENSQFEPNVSAAAGSHHQHNLPSGTPSDSIGKSYIRGQTLR